MGIKRREFSAAAQTVLLDTSEGIGSLSLSLTGFPSRSSTSQRSVVVGQQPHGSGAGRLDRLQSFSTKTIAAILLFIALVVKLHEVKKKKKKKNTNPWRIF